MDTHIGYSSVEFRGSEALLGKQSRNSAGGYCYYGSQESRQRSAEPEVTSTRLSKPKPTSAMLPAISPNSIATSPSSEFHAMVKDSSWRPRRTRFAFSLARLPDGFLSEVAAGSAAVVVISRSISSP